MGDFDPRMMMLLAAAGPQNVLQAVSDHGTLIQLGDWLLASGETEDAVLAYRKALEDLSPFDEPGEWSRVTAKLSNVLLERPDGDRSRNVEDAIAVCQNALAQLAADELTDVLYFPAGRVTYRVAGAPVGRAELFHQLAEGYAARLEGDREDNLEVALRAYRQALAYTDPVADPVNWAVEAMSLGNTFTTRLEGDRQENVGQAIALFRDAFGAFSRGGYERGRAAAAMNLAGALRDVIGDERPESVRTAIEIFEELLRVRRREIDPIGWASTTLSLAWTYLNAVDVLGADGAGEAAGLYEDVLSEPALEAEPGLRAEALHNLGLAYQGRSDEDRAASMKKAAAAFRQALDLLPRQAHPAMRAGGLTNLANLYFDQGRWAKAEPLFAEAIEVETRLLETAVYAAGRRARLPFYLHPRHAYCLLRRERYDEALVQLEAGKTRLLALAVALTAARLEALDPDLREAIEQQRKTIQELQKLREDEKAKDRFSTRLDDAAFVGALAQAREELTRLLAEARERRPGLDLDVLSAEKILALVPEDGALVAPVFTSQGSAVIIVPHGASGVTARHVLRLDHVTTIDLAALLEQISVGTEEAIEAAGEALWERLVGRIAGRLRRLKARRILLLPQGGLGLLPVHAAYRRRNGTRRYLAEEFEISYAPSAYALDTARRSARGRRDRTALVAGVSRSERFGDLPSVGDEVQMVADLLGTEPLLDSEATAATILGRAGNAAYLHLACHGAFGWGADPLESALYMAGDEPLSLSDVIGRLDLPSTRLVSLSACESGVIEASESPDEFFGLTAGFMQAGAAGVLSTLWKVDDLSTGLLVERFYRNHLENVMEPAAALREAQEWLRGLTRESVSRHLKERERVAESRDVLLFGRRDEKPYADPYHWAAFTYNGV